MKIRKTTCTLLRIPYAFPLMKQSHVLANFVEIETDDGLKGHALAPHPLKQGVREFINRDAAPVIEGMDVMCTEDVRDKLFLATANKYFAGAWNCAVSLIDIALWDIKGKALGQPVWKLLGGAHSQLPAYITFGSALYTPEQLVEVARMLTAAGQTRLKMVVCAGSNPSSDSAVRGRPTDADILVDAERVRIVREAVGPQVELMIDANRSATYPQALRLARLVEPYNLTWFEDPVVQADPRLMAHLRKQTSTPLATGSSATSDLVYMREYLLHEAVDYLQPNVRDIGGYTQGVKAAALAQAFNVPLAMGGNWPHINMHLHGGVLNGGRIEFHFQGWKVTESLFDGTPSPVNGTITLPQAPGLGFTPKAGILDLKVD